MNNERVIEVLLASVEVVARHRDELPRDISSVDVVEAFSLSKLALKELAEWAGKPKCPLCGKTLYDDEEGWLCPGECSNDGKTFKVKTRYRVFL